MSPFHATALRARQDLDRLNRPWAFVGGLAVSTRAHQRLTNDIDAAVAVADDADAERAVATMLSMGYQVEAQLERDDGRMSTIRLLCPPQSGTFVVLDLLFATTGIEAEIIASAERILVFPSFKAPVATLGHLIAMKLLSVREGRERDDLDLRDLVARSSSSDLSVARSAIAQIAAAGQSRGRDLDASLDAYVAAVSARAEASPGRTP